MTIIASNPETPAPTEANSVEERRALIQRVAASEQFSRSNRLREFLLYVGMQSLKEVHAEIHEHEIGVQVFGRQVSYDRSQDNIVRVNATELRKRVDAYFAGPGIEETLVFEIPRGSYKPVFRCRLNQAAAISSPVVEQTSRPGASTYSVVPSARQPWLNRERLLWLALVIGLAAGCAILLRQHWGMRAALKPWVGQPAVAAFWGGFLDPRRQTDLVLPDESASIIEDIAGNPIELNDYMTRAYMRQIQSSDISVDRKHDLSQIFGHNLVTFGAVRALDSVRSEIPPDYPRYVTMAGRFTADELTGNNVVLIGGAKSVPWDHLFDDLVNFKTDYDYKNGVQLVRNRNPKPGESAVYTVSVAPNSLTGYAVIDYLPSPSRSGRALILAGTDSDATAAAAAFLSSEEHMEKFRATLHVDRFPYFEILLKTSRLSGTFFDAEPIAYRTYPGQHSIQ
jgi:hypothetical protein